MTAATARRHWLVKSEPDSFSFADLVASPNGTTGWSGVRNYQARNFMRDGMKRGDLVFFYHSSTDPAAIVGVAEVAREAYPDPTAFDAKNAAFDPKSRKEDPTWMMVDIKALAPLARPLALGELREVKGLEKMVLLQKGSRLSVQPVTAEEWDIIYKLGMK
jgi:predicted RNA-binding protein with PUA-like domain